MTGGNRGSRAGVERGERVAQPPVYILVHLDVSVRGEVVRVAEPVQGRVHVGVTGGRAGHVQRGGTSGVVPGIGSGLILRHRRGLGNCVVHAPTLPRTAAVPSIAMATIEECRSALDKLSDNMQHAEGNVREAAALDRSVSCHITDLDVTFVGRMQGGRIVVRDTVQGPPPDKAEIRLAMTGDDLVALVDGELNFARAWGSGRVKLNAGVRDLLQLRKLL